MKKHVKYIFIGALAVIVVVMVILSLNQSVEVKAQKIEPQTARLFFTEKGVVESEEETSIYPLVDGKILEVYVQENQEIKEGDPICKIDTANISFEIEQSEAQARSLEAQKMNLDTEEARQRDSLITNKNNIIKELEKLNVQEWGVADTKEERIRLQNIIISQNEIDLQRAKADAAKMQTLFESGIATQNDVEDANKALENYETTYKSSLQQLQIIETGGETGGGGQSSSAYFEAAKNSLQEQIKGIDESIQKSYTGSMKQYYNAQIDLIKISIQQLNKLKEDATIVSTASGVITNLPIKNINVAVASQPIARVSSGKTLITTYVSTKDINSVTVGKEVEIILKRREGDEIYTGKIYKVENKADIKISSLGVEERKVKVYIEPPENTDLFKTGYDTDVRFLVYERENSLLVPKTAVFKDGESHMVWEVIDGKLQKTQIQKGMELRSDIVIEQGLPAGSIVVEDSTLEELKTGANVNYILE